MEKPYIEIPTWNEGDWTTTTYQHRDEFKDVITDLFKEPGQYQFDETSYQFNLQARSFNKNGEIYTYENYMTRDWKKYWDIEKEKCRKGVLYINEGKTFYLPREYYMWINFLPIFDKVKKDYDFPLVWDIQYHLSLYELLAELNYQHATMLKKRQMASSYYHMAKLLNQIWFERGVTLKMGASLEKHINLGGSWKFLNEYRSFLNEKTAWYRDMNPGGVLEWQQQVEMKDDHGRKTMRGNKGTLFGTSFENDATKGVGGPCAMFFYEEAGIAPTMDMTFEFMRPAMQAGEETTGLFIAAGSVGELKHCEPLKDFTLNPDANNMYAVEHNLMDDKGTRGRTALFIPEQWGMHPYIDKFGNSMPIEAEAAIDKMRAVWKKTLSPERYRLRISQHPKNIEEAFAYREESIFPLHLVDKQERNIEEGDYPYELIELSFTDETEKIIKVKKTTKPPITSFPVDKKMEDKTGSIVVWERPDEGEIPWGTYYGSIDPVSEGKTVTSDSLCSIYIYKNPIEVTRYDENGEMENFVEGDKIVAAWCGRFDDINKTHKRLQLIIQWYNSWTIIENNISLFIQHMIFKKKQQYLVPKNQIAFLKEVQANKTSYQDYGWRNAGTLFKAHLLSYYIEWLKEEIYHETKPDGTVVKTTYGISRIPDKMAMVEMKHYADGVNVDRLVTLASLIAFAKVQQASRGYRKRIEDDTGEHLEKSEEMFKLNKNPFRHIGRRGGGKNRPPRSPFKNIK